MSSVLNTAIAGMNAMKIMIDHTTHKMNNPSAKDTGKRIFLENSSVQKPHGKTAVKVREIYDNYNDFVLEEKRKTDVQVHDEQTKIDQLLKLEDLLCEKSIIFNQLISDLYEKIEQNTGLDKENIINKDIKEQLNDVVFAFQDFDRKLKFLELEIKESIINDISKVNTLINQIYDTTIDIRYAPFAKRADIFEELVDKRDNLVDELNDLVGVRVVKENNDYKVYLNNGICLVDNEHKQNLIPLTSRSDNRYVSVGYLDAHERIVKKIDNMIPSASLGALLKFRKEELTDTKNKIGQLAVNFAENINSCRTLGYDVFGEAGKQVLNISNPEVISSSTNYSSPIINATWVSRADAQETDYVIYLKNNHWTVRRLDNQTEVQTNIHHENNNLLITFDGIEFSIQGRNDDGDIYMIKPYSQTLEKLEVLVDKNQPIMLSPKIEIKNEKNHSFIRKGILGRKHIVNHKETLDESYQKFSKSISYKCNTLEEELPFKKNMIKILNNKKLRLSLDIEKDYQDLNYEQECYLANVKVLQAAESIFNEIIECYS